MVFKDLKGCQDAWNPDSMEAQGTRVRARAGGTPDLVGSERVPERNEEPSEGFSSDPGSEQQSPLARK